MNSEIREYINKEYQHLDSIFFNTAYFGPSPYSAKKKIFRAAQKELDPSFYNYNTWTGVPERSRRLMAKLIGCSEDNITHSTSTSDLVSIVANGFDFKEGDIVCAVNGDYPSNVIPWMVASEYSPFDFNLLDLGDEIIPTVDWLEKVLPASTKVFNVSWVTFDTGKKVDILSIGKYLRSRNILFVVDGTQALGGLPITAEELEYVDVLAISSYKWMLGAYGHAFGYFSDKAQKLIARKTGNWIASPNSKVVYNLLNYTTETLPGARKYDRGQTPNLLTLSCVEAGLDFLKKVGLYEIKKHNQDIRDFFLENYPQSKYNLITPKEYMGNILCLSAKNIDPLKLETELKHCNVDVSVRQGNIRLSFHIFNTKEQVETLIRALDI